jgi:hypothetical protein
MNQSQKVAEVTYIYSTSIVAEKKIPPSPRRFPPPHPSASADVHDPGRNGHANRYITLAGSNGSTLPELGISLAPVGTMRLGTKKVIWVAPPSSKATGKGRARV